MTASSDISRPSTYVLLPGAGGQASFWDRLVAELAERGRPTVAVELPTGDEAAGLAEYAEAIVSAVGDRQSLVLVAQSMAGFSAPLVCERLPVQLIVLLNAMVPAPGETAGDWWANTGQAAARTAQAARDGRTLGDEFDPIEEFFHDVPAEVTARAMADGEPHQADKPFGEPWPLERWPDVPTRALVGHDDRLFPAEFQRRVLEDRLGITPEVIPGGHLVALSQPAVLADRLEAYRVEAGLP